MGRLTDDVQQGKLYFSLLAKDETHLAEVRDSLSRQFSHLDVESPVFSSSDGAYYVAEMGEGILRQWVSAHVLIFVPQIVEIKRTVHQIEYQRADGGKRPVNIDPGYVTANKVVRATTRDAAHRIYMNRGIFVESVLIAEDSRTFSPWPWTDADFQSDAAGQFFGRVREAYLRQIQHSAGE